VLPKRAASVLSTPHAVRYTQASIRGPRPVD